MLVYKCSELHKRTYSLSSLVSHNDILAKYFPLADDVNKNLSIFGLTLCVNKIINYVANKLKCIYKLKVSSSQSNTCLELQHCSPLANIGHD